MYLIHLLLPLNDNEGRPHGRDLFRAVAEELTERFGGLMAHTRAPAEGLWKKGSSGTSKDEIVIYENVPTDTQFLMSTTDGGMHWKKLGGDLGQLKVVEAKPTTPAKPLGPSPPPENPPTSANSSIAAITARIVNR